MVGYDERTQRQIDEAASLYHLSCDLAKAVEKVDLLLAAAVMKLPPGSMAGYFAATSEAREKHE